MNNITRGSGNVFADIGLPDLPLELSVEEFDAPVTAHGAAFQGSWGLTA